MLGEDALRAAGDEREAFVERAALALLRKAAFVGGLEEEQEHAYIESALSDLRGRLHGWPPEPPSPNWSAHFDRLLHLAESGAVGTLVDKHVFHLAGDGRLLVLVEEVVSGEAAQEWCLRLRFLSELDTPLRLHWGFAGSGDGEQQWLLPADGSRPVGSVCEVDACDTDIQPKMLETEVLVRDAVPGLNFCLSRQDNGEVYYAGANNQTDYFIPLPPPPAPPPASPVPPPQVALSESLSAVSAPAERLQKIAQEIDGVVCQQIYRLGPELGDAQLLVRVQMVREDFGGMSKYRIALITDLETEEPLTLHWGAAGPTDPGQDLESVQGFTQWEGGIWQPPPPDWRDGAACFEDACDVSFETVDVEASGLRYSTVEVPPHRGVMGLCFVLQTGDQWVKNGDRDFFVPLPSGVLQQLAMESAARRDVRRVETWRLGRGGCDGNLVGVVREASNEESDLVVELFSDAASNLVLHWGVMADGGEWVLPPEEMWPTESEPFKKACETPFRCEATAVLCDDELCVTDESPGPGDGTATLQRLRVSVPAGAEGVDSLTFVLRTADSSVWFKEAWENYVLRLAPVDDA